MPLAKFLVSLIFLHHLAAQDDPFPSFQSPFGDVRLTSERGGPPTGAAFSPIKVINFPSNLPLLQRPPKRPITGRPPPPPPLKPIKRPKPNVGPPVAPQPPPVPSAVNQGIPLKPSVSGNIPERPPGVTVVTPITEIRPDLETIAPTLPPPTTTTPNTADSAPAYYQRFIQNEDGSYYFDFAAPNSVQRLEQGFFKRDDFHEFPILVKSGAYAFISPEGIPQRVDYVADERGYRPFSKDNNIDNQQFSYRTRDNRQ